MHTLGRKIEEKTPERWLKINEIWEILQNE